LCLSHGWLGIPCAVIRVEYLVGCLNMALETQITCCFEELLCFKKKNLADGMRSKHAIFIEL
jgi:hypothetical protein